eukprot:3490478-Amphidinium_carterae.2
MSMAIRLWPFEYVPPCYPRRFWRKVTSRIDRAQDCCLAGLPNIFDRSASVFLLNLSIQCVAIAGSSEILKMALGSNR